MAWKTNTFLFAILLSIWPWPAQEKAPAKLILKVDEKASGPFGGQKSLSCLRIYSDGKVTYASWWNSAATIVDKKTGEASRPEHTVSVEHKLEDGDSWELSSFLDSKAVRRLPGKFDPPHRPIDYLEAVSVKIVDSKGKTKQILTREYYVASLEEKTRYPATLIVLMDKISEIEKEANDKGKPIAVPADCSLQAKEH